MASAPEPAATPSPEQPTGALTSDEKMWGMLCHLSSLLGLAVAGLTFLGPLVCWVMKRDTSKFVDYNGKESLNFHLNILGYNLICLAIGFATCFVGFFVTAPIMGLVFIYGVVMTIIGGIKANSGERFAYPFIWRLIK